MTTAATPLTKKIDFAVIFRVSNANPNGDPLNGNRPRTNYQNLGEITDVALKRKIRDRLQESGHAIFVQSDDRKDDDAPSLQKRAEKAGILAKMKPDEMITRACVKWFDVRAFGQLFAYKDDKKPKRTNTNEEAGEDGDNAGSVSVGIRGPVTIQSAYSVEPVDITSVQITKSVSGEGDGSKRGSDTMGMKHRVDRGVYVFFGSMNPQLSQRTGFSDADAGVVKTILPRIFENDESSARPAGSMEVLKVLWWQHNSKAGQYSSAKVHRSLKVREDGSYHLDELAGLKAEEISGY
ncbi:MAG: type I-C CRISPR-associated protein Cas7/Csd2 [Magnetococcales bacterium]|nr:type I-C CRISPR-associated protein Cas7/Csd2 [Magnetococcales bacterium]MBF0115520.1 type I-C CRISPR-associated protein Cas7/Csd2 [Magnetococcales bacterium]